MAGGRHEMAHTDIPRLQIPNFYGKIIPFPAGGVHDVALRMLLGVVGELRILDFLFVRMCCAMEGDSGMVARQQAAVGVDDDFAESEDEPLLRKSVGCTNEAHNRLCGCFALVVVPADPDEDDDQYRSADILPTGFRFRFGRDVRELG